MPKLRDLYGMDLRPKAAYTSVMERPLTDFEREQRSAPIDRPYASGQLEAPMFAPDDLIGSGIPTKLAALAKGSIPAIAGVFIENWPGGTSIFEARKVLPANATNDEVKRRYLTNAGEVMARITEARRDMDDLQRRRQYPLDALPNLKLSDLWSE